MKNRYNIKELVVNAETLCVNVNNLTGNERFKVFDDVKNYIITQNIFEDNKLQFCFKNKNSGNEIIFCFDESVKCWNMGLDFNYIRNLVLTYTSTQAVHYSRKEKKPMFAIMIWDAHDEIHPKLTLVADNFIIKSNNELIEKPVRI